MRKRTHSPGAQQLTLFSPDLELVPQTLAPDPGQTNTIQTSHTTKQDHEVLPSTDADTAAPEAAAAEPTPTPMSDTDLELLITYSKVTMFYHGVHDQMRREWLRAWGKAHNYPRDWFTIHSQSRGYYQAAIPEGKEAWKLFLENAAAFDVYCFFIEGYAAAKRDDLNEAAALLPHLLNETSERGEIKLEDIKWTGYRAMEHRTAKDYELNPQKGA